MDRGEAIDTVYEWAYQVEQEYGVTTRPGAVRDEVREVLNALGVTDDEIDARNETHRVEYEAYVHRLPKPPR